MNLIISLRKYVKCIVSSLVVFMLILFLLGELLDIDFGIKIQQVLRENVGDKTHIEKTIASQEFSPDNSNRVILYMQEFNPNHFTDYYRDYFPNKAIISVEHQESLVKRIIFTGEERIGDPHWLGNNYIFFTTYCGTSCKGLYLINVRSKETNGAMLSFMLSLQGGRYTHFKDWFDKEFKFSGLPKDIYAEMQDGKPYLIFEMEDKENNILGKKRFLFTEDSLKGE